VGPDEYKNRVLAMALVNLVLGPPREWPKWVVLSFQVVPLGTPEIEQAQIDAGTVLKGTVYQFAVFRAGTPRKTADFRRRHVKITNKRLFLVDPVNRIVLSSRPGTRWQREVVKPD